MLSLLWLRRDLRLKDNLSLFLALENSNKVQPIFIFDEHILSRFKNPSDKRISFILETLRAIDKELKEKDSELLVFYGDPKILIPKIANILEVKQIFAGKDYEPYGLKRDAAIAKEVELCLCNDHLLLPPEKILKDDGSTYRVFTPYYRKWLNSIEPLDYAEYNAKGYNKYANSSALRKLLIAHDLHPLELYEDVPGYKHQKLGIWTLGDLDNRFEKFITSKLSSYSRDRDYLDIDGTSALSPYLRFGQISVRRCYRHAVGIAGGERWINELAWRDFYAMNLYYYPEIISQEMLPQYRSIKWSRNSEVLAKFTAGETGYPVIDAAINQLLTTGWMHNRARMIVASFMTKNLWLDWRLGEEFFAQHLMDYELSSNVGGWQWGASVGFDAQPYFRMFNPYLQSQKYDAKGIYVRKYSSSKLFSGKDTAPIVDYSESRKKALMLFKNSIYKI